MLTVHIPLNISHQSVYLGTSELLLLYVSAVKSFDCGSIASRNDYGQITFRKWHPVCVEEYGYAAQGHALRRDGTGRLFFLQRRRRLAVAPVESAGDLDARPCHSRRRRNRRYARPVFLDPGRRHAAAIADSDRNSGGIDGAAGFRIVRKSEAGKQENLARLNGELSGLYEVIGGADATPTTQAVAVVAELQKALDSLLARWHELRSRDIPALNEQLKQANLTP